MVFCDALFFQMLVKEVEKQVRLAATPYSGNYFYHPIVLAVNEFLQVNVSIYLHVYLLFLRKYAIFVCKITKIQ